MQGIQEEIEKAPEDKPLVETKRKISFAEANVAAVRLFTADDEDDASRADTAG